MRLDYKEMGCGTCIVAIFVLIAIWFVCGWLLSIIWNAIIPELWIDAPHINTLQMTGIIFIISFVGSLLFKKS